MSEKPTLPTYLERLQGEVEKKKTPLAEALYLAACHGFHNPERFDPGRSEATPVSVPFAGGTLTVTPAAKHDPTLEADDGNEAQWQTLYEAARDMHAAFLKIDHQTLAKTMNRQWVCLDFALRAIEQRSAAAQPDEAEPDWRELGRRAIDPTLSQREHVHAIDALRSALIKHDQRRAAAKSGGEP